MENTLSFTDTHSHLYDEAFAGDFDQVIARCREAGVNTLILPGISSSTHRAMIETADRLPGTAYPCIGLHPTELGENWKEELDFVKEHVTDRKFYAIGEIGLDRHWSDEFLKEQIIVFEEQICLAAKMDLPVLIHSRDATEDIFRVLEDVKGLGVRGIFHAFSGSYETYCRCLKYGDFKFGIGGVVTYKKAGIASVLPRMSPDDIVLETDCPWLTPVPHRGERNESSYVGIIARKVAEITGMSVAEVSGKTELTAKKIFGLPQF